MIRISVCSSTQIRIQSKVGFMTSKQIKKGVKKLPDIVMAFGSDNRYVVMNDKEVMSQTEFSPAHEELPDE